MKYNSPEFNSSDGASLCFRSSAEYAQILEFALTAASSCTVCDYCFPLSAKPKCRPVTKPMCWFWKGALARWTATAQTRWPLSPTVCPWWPVFFLFYVYTVYRFLHIRTYPIRSLGCIGDMYLRSKYKP